MKTTFVKVFALVLALALLLTGCNLVEVDPVMQADEDIAKLNKTYAKVVASYDGGDVTVSEVVGDFNTAYNEMYYYYSYFGMQMTEDDLVSLMQDVLNARVQNEIIAAHYDEANQLDAEALSALETSVQDNSGHYAESMLASAEGKNDAAKAENARVLARQAGLDYDSLYDSALLAKKVENQRTLLRDEIAEVSDEQLQAAYDEKVEADKEAYAEPGALENDMTGADAYACWLPEGYRTVKHILLVPEDAVKTAYTDAVSALKAQQSVVTDFEDELAALNDDDAAEGEARGAEAIQADIDAARDALAPLERAVESAAQACLDNVKDRSASAYAHLLTGDSFDEVVAEFGEDPGMQSEPGLSRGYYVCAGSTKWEQNFTDGAMALEKVGDYSAEPVVSGSGVHIIQYVADVTPGAVPLEQVHDALYDDTLENLKGEHYDETVEAWVSERNPSYDADAFKAAIIAE